MKLGLILECQPNGPDEKVIRVLFEKFAKNISIQFSTAGNKKALVETCGKVARKLFEDDCDRVAILWDLYLAEWGDTFGKHDKTPCRKQDCDRVRLALVNAEVDPNQCLLVAVENMLESWLIADSMAIAVFLSRATGEKFSQQQVGKLKPNRINKPKDALSKVFEQKGYGVYRDFVHAEKIARCVADLTDIRKKCPSFERFWSRATGW